jgi:hypothetical protein
LRPINKTAIIGGLSVAWLVLALTIFAFTSRISFVQSFLFPGWPAFTAHLARIEPARYALDLLNAFAGALAFALACLAFGLLILRALRIPRDSALAYGTTAFVVGEILFSLIFLSLISLYRLTPPITVLVLGLGFLAGLPALIPFVRGLPRPSLPDDFGPGERLRLGLVVGVLLSALLLSSARLGYDAVTQYFSHAKIMAMTGQPIFFHPDPFLVSSLHPGILFTALIQLSGDQAARMLPWLNGLAMLLLGLAIAEQLGLSPRARLWFLVLMMTTTAFLDLLGDGKVELTATAPILAAVYWMTLSLDPPSGKLFALIGLLAGYAMVARPNNVLLLGLFMILYYGGQAIIRGRTGQLEIKPLIRSALWILPPLLILGGFYLFQSAVWPGRPPAPVVAASSVAAASAGWPWQFDPSNLNWYRLFYPFVVTYSNTPQSLGNISPLLVGFLALLLLGDARRNLRASRDLLLMTLAGITTLLLWITLLFAVLEIRYVLFLWVLLYIPLAELIDGAMERSGDQIRFVITSLLLVLLAYMGGRTILIALDTYSPVDERGQAHCYDAPLCAFLDPLNRTADRGDRVLVINAYRYYLRPDLFACSSGSEEFLTLGNLARQNSPAFWVEAYRQGFDYITYEANFAEIHTGFGTLPDPELAPDWLHVNTISAVPRIGEFVYHLETTDPPFQPDRSCVQSEGSQWLIRTDH